MKSGLALEATALLDLVPETATRVGLIVEHLGGVGTVSAKGLVLRSRIRPVSLERRLAR